MASTAEKAIYDRLAAVEPFHPASANIFAADWGLEPGDVVTVKSGEESYSVPVYSMDLQWNGAVTTEIQSTGNQKREALPALRRREYAANARGYGLQRDIKEVEETFQEFETWREETDELIGQYAAQYAEDQEAIDGRITIAETAVEQTATRITSVAAATGVLLDENGNPVLDAQGHYTYNNDSLKVNLFSQVNQTATAIDEEVSRATNAEGVLTEAVGAVKVTADSVSAEVISARNGSVDLASRLSVINGAITQEVTDRTSADTTLTGLIQTEAGKISQIVSAVGANGQVTAASIVTAINATDGTGAVAIDADHVYISGDTKLSGKLSIDSSGYLAVNGVAVFNGSSGQVSINNGTVNAKNVQVGSSGSLTFVGSQTGEYYALNASNIQGFIKSVSVSGNVLTLTPVYGTPITFSKATTVTGGWDGSGTYTATATQNGETVGTASTTPTLRLDGNGTQSFSAELLDDTSSPSVQKSVYGYLVKSGSTSSTRVNVCSNSDGSGVVAGYAVGSLYTDGYDDGESSVSLSTLIIPNDASTGHPITYSATDKTISFYPEYRLSSKSSDSYWSKITIDDPGLYQAGYTAGQGSGTESVTVDSIIKNGTETFSSDYKTVTIPVKASASNGAEKNGTISGDVTQTYNAGYTAGERSVTLSASGWTGPNGTNTVTASNGESLAVSLPSFSTSGGTSFDANHKTTVYFSTPSVTSGPLKLVTVDATSVYNAGYTAGAASAGQRTATGLASTIMLTASETGASDHTVNVNYDDGSQSSISARVNASNVYAAGFNVCHDSITLSYSSGTLSPGQSITIYPRAKASVSSSTISDITSRGITITAPSFSTVSMNRSITSNGTYTYTPSSGYDGISDITITVNVPTGGGGGGGGTYTGYIMSKFIKNTGAWNSSSGSATKADAPGDGPYSSYGYLGTIDTSKHGTGGYVNLRSSPNGSTLCTVPNGATVHCAKSPKVIYEYEWMPVQYTT